MHIPAYLTLCIFAAGLAITRIFIKPDWYFHGLVWNLILAFLPYIFAYISAKTHTFTRWIFGFLWFLFLPNSFYIITDFVHLSYDTTMMYYDIVLIFSMAFAGIISGFASLEIMQKLWNQKYHKKISWIYTIVTLIIATIGVYMGRFLRFNSWDLWHDPMALVRETITLFVTNGKVLAIDNATRMAESARYTFASI